jgi:type II secretory pathway pseudopilin PulG
MPTLKELAKQEFVKDVVAMAIFGVVAAAVFLGIQSYYREGEQLQMEREAAFSLEIQFMTGGANRIKDNFAAYVAEVSEVITQGMPPDRETRKIMLASSSIIKTELAILSEYDLKLRVRGDVLVSELDNLSDDIHTYSRGETNQYREQLSELKDHYKTYILKLNSVARKHLSVGYRHYN